MKKIFDIIGVGSVLFLTSLPLYAKDLQHAISYSTMAIVATMIFVTTERG